MEHPFWSLPLAGLSRRRSASSLRASSYDRTGANEDFIRIGAGDTVTLLEHDGPGCLTHLYGALVMPDLRDYRNGILRCYWDGATEPSVQVPLGDFFGIAHARVREYASQAMAVNPGMGSSHGLNCYLPMPFSESAVVTLENRSEQPFGGVTGAFWYHIDYEAYDQPLPDDVQRFHATYRQERPTTAVGPTPNIQFNSDANTDGAENYVALEATGSGRMVGLHLQIDNVQGPVWYGEGDDMVFIDGEAWPPSIHGTGTEEIFGGGASPPDEYSGPYTGFHLVESPHYDRRVGMYRWYLHDPIHFSRSLRWTIEHGHANNFANDYASVAYWYQEPIAAADELPEPEDTLPALGGYQEAWEAYVNAFETRTDAFHRAGAALYAGQFEEAQRILSSDE
jgi:hypothetical protein